MKQHHQKDSTIYLMARPTLPNNVVLNQDLVTECTLEVYDKAGTLVWTKGLNVSLDPPVGCFFNSVTTDHTNDPWWKKDSGGYTFWYALTPGDLDDNASALDLQGGQFYDVRAVLQTEGGVTSWPELDDYGPQVVEWRVSLASSRG